jgi:transposase, IS5 family
VRVLSRVVQRAKEFMTDQVKNVQQLCRSRLRTARQTAQILHRQLRRKGEDKEAEQKKLYQKLVETTEQMVKQTSRVVNVLGQPSEQEAKQLLQEAEAVLPLIKRVIAQTRSRVLEGKKVPSERDPCSAYSSHTLAPFLGIKEARWSNLADR